MFAQIVRLVIVLSGLLVTTVGGQTCIDDVDNLQQSRNSFISPNRTVIVPRLNFTCNGRITNIRVRISTFSTGTNFPDLQVWRESQTPQLYSLVDEVQIQLSHLSTQLANQEANISLTGNSRMQFLCGDVIGFYNPSDSGYVIDDIQTDGYVFYVFPGSSASSHTLNSGATMFDRRQPLIRFTLDIQCNNLTTPLNGEITSCSSGSTGVGYEGDTCNFTCNTGYELTGSDTRTCQSNGNWSGSDATCSRVGGQTCIDDVDNLQQSRNSFISPDRTVIVPRLNFTCNGRITNIRVRISTFSTGTNFPYIQVWRQSQTPQLYSLVDEVQIQLSHLSTQLANQEANISLTGNSRMQFLCGDVIGFYNPSDSGYVIDDIQTDGYVFYVFPGSSASSQNLSTGVMSSRRQPLIQFTLDIQCNNLTTPSNGVITSCSSDSIGVGYEGDTCSFTCNTGYELTGSHNRTCWSNGNWSGSDDVCIRVSCINLTDPTNGMVTCSLGDDNIATDGDTCNYICDTGYVLSGNAMRTCGSIGMWDGTEPTCIGTCPMLTDPTNGMITCSLGVDGAATDRDTCTAMCNPGYEIQSGDVTRTCSGSDMMWSGTEIVCEQVGAGASTTSSNDSGSGVVIALAIVIVLLVIGLFVSVGGNIVLLRKLKTVKLQYKVSQVQTGYTEVHKPSRNVSATRLHKKPEETMYETVDNEGGNDAYSTAVIMQNNPAYQATGTQPSNDSVYF
ncbi:P-selectin-like isoform X2 [Dysidea avara]|uniref:P-selectin-like isoform X2 n=1 Tax=Dysidea avara TaxID=196820 RepID=UPI00331B8497